MCKKTKNERNSLTPTPSTIGKSQGWAQGGMVGGGGTPIVNFELTPHHKYFKYPNKNCKLG